jgi:hypothetical protein
MHLSRRRYGAVTGLAAMLGAEEIESQQVKTKEFSMSKRLPIYFLAVAAAAALAVSAASASSATHAAKAVHAINAKTVTIAMHDPGCHWFTDHGKYYKSVSVKRGTTFRNVDEAAVIFKGQGFTKHLAVGKTLKISKAGTYHVTMVKQAPDDNHLLLIVK